MVVLVFVLGANLLKHIHFLSRKVSPDLLGMGSWKTLPQNQRLGAWPCTPWIRYDTKLNLKIEKCALRNQRKVMFIHTSPDLLRRVRWNCEGGKTVRLLIINFALWSCAGSWVILEEMGYFGRSLPSFSCWANNVGILKRFMIKWIQ